jgi:predicted CopG family antitoxin
MPKTVTLRLSDEVYRRLSSTAAAENRSISNLIETLALKKLNDEMFTDEFETEEILSNMTLLKKLERGHRQARLKKGVLIG